MHAELLFALQYGICPCIVVVFVRRQINIPWQYYLEEVS